jgi:signal transduction histidine kinase
MPLGKLCNGKMGGRRCILLMSFFSIAITFFLDYLFLNFHEGYNIFLVAVYLFPVILTAESAKTRNIDVMLVLLVSSITWYVGDIMKGHNVTVGYNNLWVVCIVTLLYTAFAYITLKVKSYRIQLEKQNEELARLNDIKTRNLGIASHDIKNPLSVILFSADILLRQQQFLTSEHISFIQRIKVNAIKINKLIDDQLNWSKLENGSMVLKIENMDYLSLVESVIANFNMLRRKDISVVLECTYGDITAFADRFRIEEVLSNLIGNAIKFSYSGTMVTVRISRDEHAVLTEVIDNGVGIPENELQKIFKPFVRGSSVATAGEGSTGLGLAIVEKIVKGHGGSIKVKSSVGRGSNFNFTLPNCVITKTINSNAIPKEKHFTFHHN